MQLLDPSFQIGIFPISVRPPDIRDTVFRQLVQNPVDRLVTGVVAIYKKGDVLVFLHSSSLLFRRSIRKYASSMKNSYILIGFQATKKRRGRWINRDRRANACNAKDRDQSNKNNGFFNLAGTEFDNMEAFFPLPPACGSTGTNGCKPVAYRIRRGLRHKSRIGGEPSISSNPK